MKTFFTLLVLCLGVGSVFFAYYLSHHMKSSSDHLATREVRFATTSITVEVADTETLRNQGLSGRSGLAPGQGMLFVFDDDNPAQIWMKDMLFPIDIVWLSADGAVITVTPDVSPDTYPEVFSPAQWARYVLELPAGYAQSHHIAEGTNFVL
jgi:uncharacterized membrane protein (UPF0127 family)